MINKTNLLNISNSLKNNKLHYVHILNKKKTELETTQGQDLRSVGITPAGLEADINTGQELAAPEGGVRRPPQREGSWTDR